MTASATSLRRFTAVDPCPVCGGHPGLPRGQGVRCAGYVGSDGLYAHCTRDQHAGALAPDDATPPTYAHRLGGECRCGRQHTPGPAAVPVGRSVGGEPWGQPEATFDYLTAAGSVAYQVVRFPGKEFRQRRPDGSGWAWGLKGTARVLYRLPELLASDPARAVFVVEGEKDVETLRGLGFVATTNSGGSGAWRSEFAEPFACRLVVILPDNDDPGRKWAHTVARDLLEAGAALVRVVELPGLPEHGDVTDWLTAGHTASEFKQLIRESLRAAARSVLGA